MNDAKIFSIFATCVVLFVLYVQRRVIFSFSAIAIFWLTHLIFLFFGLLFTPWIFNFLGQSIWFASFNFDMISEENMIKVIVLTVGGGILVLVFYHITNLLFFQKKNWRSVPALIQPFDPHLLGFSSERLVVFSLLVLAFALGYVMMNLSQFMRGIMEGLYYGDSTAVIAARREVGGNYIFILATFNFLPFLGVALTLYSFVRRSTPLTLYVYFFNFFTSFLLFGTFLKRPLILFLGCLMMVRIIHSINRQDRVFRTMTNKKLYAFLLRKVSFYFSLLFVLLGVLFVLHSQVGRQEDTVVLAIQDLFMVSCLRIFGRLSLPALFYVHYYPSVEGFYGFSNIGLLSQVMGTEHYPETLRVFEYFSGFEGGHVACSALIDFYGGFGYNGWFVGAILLGVGLSVLDRFLYCLPNNYHKVLLITFMFVFVYYLSQASVPRSLAGYGGGYFFALWLLLKQKTHPHLRALPERNKIPSATPTGE